MTVIKGEIRCIKQENLVRLNQLSEELVGTEDAGFYFMEIDKKKPGDDKTWERIGWGIPNPDEKAFMKHSIYDVYLYQGEFRYLMNAQAFNVLTKNLYLDCEAEMYL